MKEPRKCTIIYRQYHTIKSGGWQEDIERKKAAEAGNRRISPADGGARGGYSSKMTKEARGNRQNFWGFIAGFFAAKD
jgi:hypothetical protein